MTPPSPAPPLRPRLNAVAGPLLGEFLLGMTVATAGLWLASNTSDAAGGAFGLVGQVQEALSVIFRVLAIGLGVLIGQTLGAGQHERARRTAMVALGAGTWAGLCVFGWMIFGNSLTLDLLNSPESVERLAAPYMMALAPALLLDAYNLSMSAILRAHLHARESLRVMVAMHLTHLLLAVPLMRGVGDWAGFGLLGYALAMLVSRALGLALHLALWRRKMDLVPARRDWWSVPLPLLLPVLRIGLPGAAVEMVYRLGFMVSLAATARLGAEALATHSYALQMLKYVVLVSLAIGWACEIMVGRLVGAGELSDADRLVRKGVRNGLLASGSFALVVALAAPWLLRAFTRDPQIVAAAQTLLWLSLALETGRVFNLVLTGALRATGDVVVPAAAGMASMVLVMGVGSTVLGRLFGLPGIWISYALDEWVRGLVLLARWYRRGWLRSARDTQRSVRSSR
jgi:putative MATE family efflux protein